MKTLFSILKYQVETPKIFGMFHIISIAILILLTVFLCVKFKNCSDKTFRKICLVCWIIFLVVEAYKQFVFTYDYTPNGVVGDYQWYAFPFQLCSTSFYVLPFIAFLKDGKVRDCCISYMMTFTLFGGLTAFCYPGLVYIEYLGINIQTMVWHGLQISLGVFFAVHQREKINLKFFFKGVIVFVILCAVACLLNEVVFSYLSTIGSDESFNMFYISRHFENHLPLLSTAFKTMPYVVYLMLYILGFTFISFAIFCVIYFILKCVNKKKKNEA